LLLTKKDTANTELSDKEKRDQRRAWREKQMKRFPVNNASQMRAERTEREERKERHAQKHHWARENGVQVQSQQDRLMAAVAIQRLMAAAWRNFQALQQFKASELRVRQAVEASLGRLVKIVRLWACRTCISEWSAECKQQAAVEEEQHRLLELQEREEQRLLALRQQEEQRLLALREHQRIEEEYVRAEQNTAAIRIQSIMRMKIGKGKAQRWRIELARRKREARARKEVEDMVRKEYEERAKEEEEFRRRVARQEHGRIERMRREVEETVKKEFEAKAREQEHMRKDLEEKVRREYEDKTRQELGANNKRMVELQRKMKKEQLELQRVQAEVLESRKEAEEAAARAREEEQQRQAKRAKEPQEQQPREQPPRKASVGAMGIFATANTSPRRLAEQKMRNKEVAGVKSDLKTRRQSLALLLTGKVEEEDDEEEPVRMKLMAHAGGATEEERSRIAKEEEQSRMKREVKKQYNTRRQSLSLMLTGKVEVEPQEPQEPQEVSPPCTPPEVESRRIDMRKEVAGVKGDLKTRRQSLALLLTGKAEEDPADEAPPRGPESGMAVVSLDMVLVGTRLLQWHMLHDGTATGLDLQAIDDKLVKAFQSVRAIRSSVRDANGAVVPAFSISGDEFAQSAEALGMTALTAEYTLALALFQTPTSIDEDASAEATLEINDFCKFMRSLPEVARELSGCGTGLQALSADGRLKLRMHLVRDVMGLSHPAQLEEDALAEAFMKYDEEGNECISRGDFAAAAQSIGFKPGSVELIVVLIAFYDRRFNRSLAMFDPDRKGVRYADFIDFVVGRGVPTEQEQIEERERHAAETAKRLQSEQEREQEQGRKNVPSRRPSLPPPPPPPPANPPPLPPRSHSHSGHPVRRPSSLAPILEEGAAPPPPRGAAPVAPMIQQHKIEVRSAECRFVWFRRPHFAVFLSLVLTPSSSCLSYSLHPLPVSRTHSILFLSLVLTPSSSCLSYSLHPLPVSRTHSILFLPLVLTPSSYCVPSSRNGRLLRMQP
jgi:hypothetical protein